jgi:hypothetical protein
MCAIGHIPTYDLLGLLLLEDSGRTVQPVGSLTGSGSSVDREPPVQLDLAETARQHEPTDRNAQGARKEMNVPHFRPTGRTSRDRLRA